MNWSVVADVVNAAALTIGVVFAATQLGDIRRQRKRDAMLALVRSFQSGDFTTALRQINSLPDGADRAAIRATLGPDGEDQVFMIGLTLRVSASSSSATRSPWTSSTTSSAGRS